MAERPILFSGPMVCAILDGRKTQTRRVIRRLAADPDHAQVLNVTSYGMAQFGSTIPDDPVPIDIRCPYGGPGDRLWVRETWGLANRNHWPDLPHTGSAVANGVAYYRASFDRASSGMRWRPSIHMPRWASRLTLNVTGVRVERLQDISEEDARAEGVEANDDDGVTYYGPLNHGHASAAVAFGGLWDEINGKRAPWESNPFVWVVEFVPAGPRDPTEGA